MDKNVLSPEQLRTLQVFQYDKINPIVDVSLNSANEKLMNVMHKMSTQNATLQRNATNLQSILDSIILPKQQGNPELIEEIKWNRYFYKKYTYQTHVMIVLIFMCIVINILHATVSHYMFVAFTGFILSIAFVYIGYILWDLLFRDNMNFDEYKFSEYTGEFVHSHRKNSDKEMSNCVIRKIEDHYTTP